MRHGMMLLICLTLGCSGGSSDSNKANPNNDSDATNNASNNASNNGTSGSNNDPGTNNTTETNNGPGTNNTTGSNNEAAETSPFAGVCTPPTTSDTDDGCTVNWRCAQLLTLECTDDGADMSTCVCTKDGRAANSFSSPTAVCAGEEDALTQLASDQCSWNITYANELSCEPGEQQSGRAVCSWTWGCGGMDYQVECMDDRNGGYDCTCSIDGRPTGIAFPANICNNSEQNAIRTAQAGCGWAITTD